MADQQSSKPLHHRPCECGCGLAVPLPRRFGKWYQCRLGKLVKGPTTPNWQSRAFRAWVHMGERCYNPRRKGFLRYGGRGIAMCERWHSFDAFLADMGEPEPGYSIDRIDNDGNYAPENCRWATRQQQANNTRRNRRIAFNGENLTFRQWEQRLGWNRNTIASRIDTQGWDPIRAVSTPPRPKTPDFRIPFRGQILNAVQFSRATSVPAHTVLRRLRRGYTPEDIAREFQVSE